MAWDIAGKTVIITGATSGIGLEAAIALAGRGARPVIVGRHPDRLAAAGHEIKAKTGVGAPSYLCDFSSQADIRRLAARLLDDHPRIDVLVNNAGILRLAPLESITEERWDETLGVHLKGTFNCTQAVIPIMKQQKKGKIINIAAPSALRGSYGVADYAAAKGGIVALTKNAANELKAYNIQVNCISPVADTRMTEDLTKFRREQLGISRRDREVVPPEAIAPAFLFFATGDSDYVSGQLLEVGRT